ncbi:transposase [Paenibacillus sp. Dod16]
MDEQPIQRLGDLRPPQPMKPGQILSEKIMNMFAKEAAACSCSRSHSLDGVTYRLRKDARKLDWALQIQKLLEAHYPEAKRVRLVMDNLNTHTISSLYETLPPEQALVLAKRLETHYTPKHGSWLNITEIKLSVMTIQCLNRRIASIEEFQAEVSAWETERNRIQKSVAISTEQAREK